MILTKRKEGEEKDIYYKKLYNKSVEVIKKQEKKIEKLQNLIRMINLNLLCEMEKNVVLEINSVQYN